MDCAGSYLAMWGSTDWIAEARFRLDEAEPPCPTGFRGRYSPHRLRTSHNKAVGEVW
mgnify:CR=1 FL=1